MKAEVFSRLLKELNDSGVAELTINVNETEYVRRFVSGERLILLGGGHVALDVYSIALLLGFRIVVVDDRPEFANSERFPEAQTVCDAFTPAIQRLSITDKDYVCILTRGHRWDQECLEAVLSGTMPYYLGMIGSKRRVAGMKDILREKSFSDEDIQKIHSPIGLSINAVTTAEIALAICAEMIQEKRKVKYQPRDNELMQTNVDESALQYLASSDEPRAMLLVLNSTGSTPVKSGSLMAVNRLCKGYGTIGGGCSEAEAVNIARRIIGTSASKVIEIDMTNEVAADNGMVCGGRMTVYIEDVR